MHPVGTEDSMIDMLIEAISRNPSINQMCGYPTFVVVVYCHTCLLLAIYAYINSGAYINRWLQAELVAGVLGHGKETTVFE